MLACGAPLWRLRLSMRTLHPLMAAIIVGVGKGRRIRERASKRRTGWRADPAISAAPSRSLQPNRRRVQKTAQRIALSDADHNVLHELKARGGTDYFANSAEVLRCDDCVAGCDDGCRGRLLGPRTSSGLPRSRPFWRRSSRSSTFTACVAFALPEAYLGPRTGRRVLEGQITRGDFERIGAAILVSDIRDWTGLNYRLPAEEALGARQQVF